MKTVRRMTTIIVVFALIWVVCSCDSKKTTEPEPSVSLTILNNTGSTITSAHIRVVDSNDWGADLFTAELPDSLARTIKLPSKYPAGKYDIQLGASTLENYMQTNIQLNTGNNQLEFTIDNLLDGVVYFGGRRWITLATQGNRTLIITEDIIERMKYNTRWTAMTWENSSLRDYLNGAFYNSFNESNRSRIVQVTNQNLANQYYGTPGGNATHDKIFLLSLAEVVQYFGDSGQLGNDTSISDQYNSNRIAHFNGAKTFWWLRSPGEHDHNAAVVLDFGQVTLQGYSVYDNFGVRPACWITP